MFNISRKEVLDHDAVNDAAQQLKRALESIQEQFDDHLNAINENTNEIQANFELFSQIEQKLDKLAERIDKIQIFLEKNHNFVPENAPRYNIEPLSKQEKEIFMVLYALEEAKGTLTYHDLARGLGVTDKTAQDYIGNLMRKGIPILKKYTRNTVYFCLDRDFKTVQAKSNLLHIEQQNIQNWG